MKDGAGAKSAGMALSHPESGLGAPCWEAQADGVPCDELGVDCSDCERVEAPSVRSQGEEPETA
jgi:hypothetical protein